MIKTAFYSAILSLGLASSAFAADKWDMPTPYGDGNHPTQVANSFAKEVTEKSDGKLTIKVHSGGSLIKHPEIHRAVKSRQVQIGEVFIGRLGNDAPVFKVDNLPFLATDFDSAQKLYDYEDMILRVIAKFQEDNWKRAEIPNAFSINNEKTFLQKIHCHNQYTFLANLAV